MYLFEVWAKTTFPNKHYSKMHGDGNTILPQNICFGFLVSISLLPGTSGKKIFQFPYFLGHSDKENRIL
jgi:hypothetical protein